MMSVAIMTAEANIQAVVTPSGNAAHSVPTKAILGHVW